MSRLEEKGFLNLSKKSERQQKDIIGSKFGRATPTARSPSTRIFYRSCKLADSFICVSPQVRTLVPQVRFLGSWAGPNNNELTLETNKKNHLTHILASNSECTAWKDPSVVVQKNLHTGTPYKLGIIWSLSYIIFRAII